MQSFNKIPGPFTVIAKSITFRPEQIARIQTDGSFKIKPYNLSRTAVILQTKSNVNYKLMTTYLNHKSSTESEWNSVIDGIKFSIKKNEYSIELENDNLGVMSSLINRKKPKGLLIDYYYYIFELGKNIEWLSIRWIPRELNKADELFRL